VTAPGWKRRLDPRAEVVVFRIVQEALNNIAKHSGATEAEVRLEVGDDRLDVTVADNGRGFAPQRLTGAPAGARGLGLLGMRERAGLIGGEFSVDSVIGHGTTVRLRVPLRLPVESGVPAVSDDARAAR
jgi:signal transduction histidine kinase